MGHNLSYDEVTVALGYIPAKDSSLVTVNNTTNNIANAINNIVSSITNTANGIVAVSNDVTTLTTRLIDVNSNLFAQGTALGELLSKTTINGKNISTIQQSLTSLNSVLIDTNTHHTLAFGNVNSRLTSAITNYDGQITVINNTLNSLVGGIGINDTVYYQSSAPTIGMVVNDLWIDSDNNNAMYVWNGSSWISVDNTSYATISALTTESNTRATNDTSISNNLTSLYNQVNNATTGLPATATALTALSTNVTTNYALASSVTTLSSTVDAKNRIYYQSSAPVSGMRLNDIWIRLSDSKYYIYNGSTWISTDTITATGAAALVSSEASTRASADSAQANAILGVSSTLNGTTTAISQALNSIDGIKGKYTLTIDSSHNVTGFELIGNGTGLGNFTLLNANLTMNGAGAIMGGKTSFYDLNSGYFMGYQPAWLIYSAGYKFQIGDDTNAVTWDGSNLTVTGAIYATSGSFSGNLIVGGTITGAKIATGSNGVDNVNVVNGAISSNLISNIAKNITTTSATTVDEDMFHVGSTTVNITLISSGTIFIQSVAQQYYDGTRNTEHRLYVNGTMIASSHTGIALATSVAMAGGINLGAGTYRVEYRWWATDNDVSGVGSVTIGTINMNTISLMK